MSLKTRLDGRSEHNNSLRIKDSQGNIIATIKMLDASGSTLEVTTVKGLHVDKPNGWCSKTQ